METIVLVMLGIVVLAGWVWFCWNHPFLALLLSLLSGE